MALICSGTYSNVLKTITESARRGGSVIVEGVRVPGWPSVSYAPRMTLHDLASVVAGACGPDTDFFYDVERGRLLFAPRGITPPAPFVKPLYIRYKDYSQYGEFFRKRFKRPLFVLDPMDAKDSVFWDQPYICGNIVTEHPKQWTLNGDVADESKLPSNIERAFVCHTKERFWPKAARLVDYVPFGFASFFQRVLQTPSQRFAPREKKRKVVVLTRVSRPHRDAWIEKLWHANVPVVSLGGHMQTAESEHLRSIIRSSNENTEDFLDGTRPFYEPYAFVLCVENHVGDGNVSEKIFNAYLAGCIPLYLGSASVKRMFAPETYVDLSEYADDEGGTRLSAILGDSAWVNRALRLVRENAFWRDPAFLRDVVREADHERVRVRRQGSIESVDDSVH